MKSRRTIALIRKIAEEENLTVKQVEEIVYSFFRFTSTKMKEGLWKDYNFPTIRLFKFGLFKVKDGRRRYIKNRDEKLNEYRKRSSDNLSGSVDDQGVQKDLEQGPIQQEG